MIAEVTHPSTGVGVEVAWADQYHIPIIAIAKTGVHMSQSVRNLATHFIEYDSESELIERLQEIIKH